MNAPLSPVRLAPTRPLAGRVLDDLHAVRAFDVRALLAGGGLMFALGVLLALDMAALVADVLATAAKHLDLLSHDDAANLFRLDTEYGPSAYYGYAKLFAIAALLAFVWRRRQSRAFGFLAAVFLYAALDDSLLLHERAGRALAGLDTTGLFDGTLGHGLAEAAYFGIVGLFILGLLAAAVRSARGPDRPAVLLLTGLMLVIGFCAVGVNLMEAAFADISRIIMKALSLLDDGGELVASTLALVLSAGLARMQTPDRLKNPAAP